MVWIIPPVGAGNAKLVVQKAKGMPVIVISLLKLDEPEARESISNLSLELFSFYKSTSSLVPGGNPSLSKIMGHSYYL